VILLDEFEKCDRSVQRLFMSVFDEGILTTSQGSVIDFSKSIIIATTNASCTAKSRSIGFNSDSTSDTQLISDLSDYFDVELINRFSQKYTFSEISRSVYRKIVENRLVSEIKVIKRLRPELNMDSLFSADELAKAVDKITADTYNIKSGARPATTAVSKFIDSKLLSNFSRMAKTYRPNQN
jgi:ATP-dependent Clp protease ATP-binding subunit ClpA